MVYSPANKKLYSFRSNLIGAAAQSKLFLAEETSSKFVISESFAHASWPVVGHDTWLIAPNFHSVGSSEELTYSDGTVF